MPQSSFCNQAAVVYKSCVYVVHGQGIQIWRGTDLFGVSTYFWEPKAAYVFCFDPKRNVWKQKASNKSNQTLVESFTQSLFTSLLSPKFYSNTK